MQVSQDAVPVCFTTDVEEKNKRQQTSDTKIIFIHKHKFLNWYIEKHLLYLKG